MAAWVFLLNLLPLVHCAQSFTQHGVCFFKGAFTPKECDAIVKLMKTRPAERDVRVEESVSRVNYFDATAGRLSRGDGKGPYDWIYERILKCAREASDDGTGDAVEWGYELAAAGPKELSLNTDFLLLHEFKGNDFFDWHVDTKPGDGTGRTVNVNVMLSQLGKDYEGGGIEVGELDVQPSKGDMYWYPAHYPHRVTDVSSGARHTFIVAAKAPSDGARQAAGFWARGEENLRTLTAPTRIRAAARAAVGGHATAVLERDAVSVPSKWHMLLGELLAAQGMEKEADAEFANAYAVTDEAAEYATRFDEDGQRLVAQGKLAESLPFFKMASTIAKIASLPPNAQALFESHWDAIASAL